MPQVLRTSTGTCHAKSFLTVLTSADSAIVRMTLNNASYTAREFTHSTIPGPVDMDSCFRDHGTNTSSYPPAQGEIKYGRAGGHGQIWLAYFGGLQKPDPKWFPRTATTTTFGFGFQMIRETCRHECLNCKSVKYTPGDSPTSVAQAHLAGLEVCWSWGVRPNLVPSYHQSRRGVGDGRRVLSISNPGGSLLAVL